MFIPMKLTLEDWASNWDGISYPGFTPDIRALKVTAEASFWESCPFQPS